MKKITFLFLSAALIFGALSCQREVSIPDEKPARYANLQVSVGRDTEGVESKDTKSIVSSDVENFQKAILFAMNPSTKKVYTYGSNAGDLEGQPIIVETSEKTFNWALPMETRMDIYALVNYGDIDVSTYKSKGTNLTISDLEGITFSCTSVSELAKLEQSSYGLPMAGITEIQATDIKTGEETISIKAKKLFARYNLYLDLSDLVKSNSSVVAESAVIYNMNNTVHFFKEGDKKSGSIDVSKYDRATEEQLEILQAGGNSNQVVFYVLENMQGDMAGASSWQTVYRELGIEKVKYCTYLNFNVNVVNPQGRAESRNYRIYLGKTDMKSNFDVQRNYDKTIRLAIKDVPDIFVPGAGNVFNWTDSAGNLDYSTLTVAQEEDITLHFRSDLDLENISYKVYNDDTDEEITTGYSFTDKTLNTSTHRGSVNFTPSSSINVGTKLRIIGGSDDGPSDVRYLEVNNTLVLEARELHKADYFGEWSLYEFDKDIINNAWSLGWSIFGIEGGTEHRLHTNGMQYSDDPSYGAEDGSLSRDGKDGHKVELEHAKVAYCYSSSGDVRTFVYLGDDTYSEYKVTFWIEDEDGNVLGECSFNHTPKMPQIRLDGVNASSQLYVNRESEKYLKLVDPDTDQVITNRFIWGGCYDAATNNTYKYVDTKYADGTNSTTVLYDFLRGAAQPAYNTIEKVINYYNIQDWFYEGLLLDYLSADYIINTTNTKCGAVIFDETQATLPGVLFKSESSFNNVYSPLDYVSIKPTLHQGLFKDDLKVYLTYRGSKRFTTEFDVYPMFIVDNTTLPHRYYLSAVTGNHHKARADLNVVIKFKGENYTFLIKKEAVKANSMYPVSISNEDEMETWQGVSISPSTVTENAADNCFDYTSEIKYVFGDSYGYLNSTVFEQYTDEHYTVEFYPDTYWRSRTKGAGYWVLSSPLAALGPAGWVIMAMNGFEINAVNSGIYGMRISSYLQTDENPEIIYRGESSYVKVNKVDKQITDVVSSIIYNVYDENGNLTRENQIYSVSSGPSENFWWNDKNDSNGRDDTGIPSESFATYQIYDSNGQVDTRSPIQFKGWNLGSERYIPVGVILKSPYNKVPVRVNMVYPAVRAEDDWEFSF